MNPLIQEIKPSSKSIRQIPVPIRRERSSASDTDNEPLEEEKPKKHRTRMEPTKKQKKGIPNSFLWIIVIAVIIALGFSISYVLSGATVTVFARQLEVPVDLLISAKKEAIVGDLQFDYITVGKTASANVTASGQEFVERKATGKIIIYNNFSTTPQRLIKSTRFETPEGLIFRLDNAVNIPGKKIVAGESIPGSVEATVTADATGTKYNISLKDFTIPGFKSDEPRFKGFYARSISSFEGGFSGNIKKVDKTVLQSATTKLRSELDTNIKSLANMQVPTNAVFFNDAIFTTYTTLPRSDSGETGATIHESATSTVVYFNEDKFAAYLAKSLIPNYDGSAIKITNFNNLVFTVSNKTNTNPIQGGVVTFNIKGPVHFEWVVDDLKLQKDLIGKSKKDIASVLTKYPSIVKAEAVVRPFWKTSFPTKPVSIKIILSGEKTTN